MNFLKYKKLLERNNIILFDHEYRISYFEITNTNNIMNTNMNSNNMAGGGDIYNKLKNINIDTLNTIVKLSISSNPLYITQYI